MAKEKTVYVCTNCGQESPKWAGKCPSCGQWNTFVEEVVRKEMPVAKHVAHGIESVRSKPQRLHEITSGEEQRIDMGDDELNRVLGGGLVEGSLTLIGGEPGIGKSTLVLQTVLRLTDKKVLYISGEESARQLKLRADRIPHPEANNLLIACETSLEQIFTNIKNTAPDLVIIDSIQTISTENIDSSPGSIVQVRECSASILKFAKETGTPVILIGHINKEGSIAGPKVLEHIVDTVLQFEGDQHYMYRILRSIKNRFGSTAELGIANLKRIVPEIIKWTTTGEKGQTYEEASRLYYAVITQWNNYLYHVMANIGGIYIENTTVGDGVKTYTYVEKEKQEASLDFLLNEVLCYPRWLFDTEISDYTFLLRKNPTGVIEYAPSQILKNTQGYIFWDLLSNDRLMRMLENELKNGKKAFTVVEMMDKMHNSIFATTIKGGTPDVMERNLQKGFLDALITAAAESEGVKINKQLTATSGNPYLFHHTPWCSHDEFAIEQAERMGARRELSFYGGQVNRISDAISVKRGELLRIKKLLESRRNTSDTAARYHYDDMILRINTALGLKD